MRVEREQPTDDETRCVVLMCRPGRLMCRSRTRANRRAKPTIGNRQSTSTRKTRWLSTLCSSLAYLRRGGSRWSHLCPADPVVTGEGSGPPGRPSCSDTLRRQSRTGTFFGREGSWFARHAAHEAERRARGHLGSTCVHRHAHRRRFGTDGYPAATKLSTFAGSANSRPWAPVLRSPDLPPRPIAMLNSSPMRYA